MSEYQLTTIGLPNTCSVCGKPQEGEWYAKNIDEARSGLGICAADLKKVEAAEKKAATAAAKKAATTKS